MSDPNQPGYGYPQQPGQNPYNQPPGQPGYGYPQQQPMAAAPGQYTGDPNAPYGYDPYGRPLSDKSKIVAGVLTLFIGSLGIGRFYTGHIGMGIAQLLTCGGLGIWSLVDGIIFLTSDSRTDAQGRILRG
ncbi:NINE protein [Streptomyces sp. CA-250714]|uniref:TM2 domain-containing protein n=1 Tax=Streptomyces sp. CA-250714 TaxID=3240060 RepID=UPI003D934424